MFVTDFPIWEDCPYRHWVPDVIEIRRGEAEGESQVIFWNPRRSQHITVNATTFDPSDSRGLIHIVTSLSSPNDRRHMLPRKPISPKQPSARLWVGDIRPHPPSRED